MSADAIKFLEAILPDAIGGYICAWRKETKLSLWSQSNVEIAQKTAKQIDWYITMSRGPKGSAKQRVTKQTALGIGCIWLDVDVATGVHGKPNLPPSCDDALNLIKEPLEPSIIVNSGGGLHVYWLLNEPWIFEDDDNRIHAAALVRAWQAFIRRRAQDHGWALDSTHDLARLMRIPETLNAKTNPPLPVILDKFNESIRYDITDFDSYLGNSVEVLRHTIRSSRVVGDIIIAPDAQPPMRKFAALMDADLRARRTFDRTRRNMTDKSPSGFDAALACVAVEAGWSDQEIADLIIASRARAGEPIHADNPKKYITTIASARDFMTGKHAQQNIEHAVVTGESKDIDNKSKMLADLSKQIHPNGDVNVTRIVRFMSDPHEYLLETDHGSIRLGTIDGVTSQTKFRNSIAALASYLMSPLGAIPWMKLAQAVLDLAEDENPGMETTDAGRAEDWLWHYLDDHCPTIDEDDAVAHRLPFLRGDEIFFFTTGPVTSLSAWLRARYDTRLSLREMGTALRRFGAEPRTVRIAGRIMHTWTIPAERFEEIVARIPKLKIKTAMTLT